MSHLLCLIISESYLQGLPLTKHLTFEYLFIYLFFAQTQDIDQLRDANDVVKASHFDLRQGEGVLFCVATG